MTTVNFEVDESVYNDAQTALRTWLKSPTSTPEDFCVAYLKKYARSKRERDASTTAVAGIDTTGL